MSTGHGQVTGEGVTQPDIALIRNTDFYAHPGPAYDVLVDGQKVGTVYRGTATFERGPRGARYVTRRWESPRWYADSRLPLDRTTRIMAIADVLAEHSDHQESFCVYEGFARAARTVRPGA